MPRPVTVWAVELGPEVPPEEIKGALALESDALWFAPGTEGHPRSAIALGSISKVRRLRGSPVMMVTHGRGADMRRTAFYFAQPPPLGGVTGRTTEPPASGLAAFRNPRRKARRDNLGYLGVANREKKVLVSEWVRAVRAAAGVG
jgi:hypothetical protein